MKNTEDKSITGIILIVMLVIYGIASLIVLYQIAIGWNNIDKLGELQKDLIKTFVSYSGFIIIALIIKSYNLGNIIVRLFGGNLNNSDTAISENTTPVSIDTASIIENIKDDVRDLFTDRNFIQHYKKDTLFQVTETLLTEICKRNFNGLEALLTKEIIDIISMEKGFYSKVDIIYETQVLQDGTIQTTTTRKMYGEIKDSVLKGSMKIDILPNKKREEQLFLLEIKINEQSINIKDIDSSYDDDIELSKQNKIKLNFNIDLTPYSKIDSIESKIVTIEKASNIHTLAINRPTKNLSVEYIYNPKHIKNPNFVSKYGETELTNLIKEPISKDKAHIKYNYGNKVFLPKEFFFIYYETNEE